MARRRKIHKKLIAEEKVDALDGVAGHDVLSESSVYCNENCDYFHCLSMEIICRIFDYLPVSDIMRMESLCRNLSDAVTMHLRLLESVDFVWNRIYVYMSPKITDKILVRFLARCPELRYIYGLHPNEDMVKKRRSRVDNILSISGIVHALKTLPKLVGVETSNIFLLEAILNRLPDVKIVNHFHNRNGGFPALQSSQIVLTKNCLIGKLTLTGVIIPNLPHMDSIKYLTLKWVVFTDLHPFKEFGAPSLKSFVMNNCSGPVSALKYVPLFTGLAAARGLARLELIRVPFLGEFKISVQTVHCVFIHLFQQY